MKTLGLLIVMLTTAVASAQSSRPTVPGTEPQDAMTGRRERKMANCPSAVQGARTQVTPTPDGVAVTVTADSPDAQHRIYALAEIHARLDTTALGYEHTGWRGSTGRIGYCPIIHERTTVTATAIPRGARIDVKASSPDEVRALQQATMQRAQRLPRFGSS